MSLFPEFPHHENNHDRLRNPNININDDWHPPSYEIVEENGAAVSSFSYCAGIIVSSFGLEVLNHIIDAAGSIWASDLVQPEMTA